jgi:hypothetical protein
VVPCSASGVLQIWLLCLTLAPIVCNICYMNSHPRTITETLRQAIAKSGMNFLALERKTGVLRQSLMKFVRGERLLRGDAYDKLARFFGLELRPRR